MTRPLEIKNHKNSKSNTLEDLAQTLFLPPLSLSLLKTFVGFLLRGLPYEKGFNISLFRGGTERSVYFAILNYINDGEFYGNY